MFDRHLPHGCRDPSQPLSGFDLWLGLTDPANSALMTFRALGAMRVRPSHGRNPNCDKL